MQPPSSDILNNHVVHVTIETTKYVPRDYDLVAYERTLQMAYANLLKDPNVKVHVKG